MQGYGVLETRLRKRGDELDESKMGAEKDQIDELSFKLKLQEFMKLSGIQNFRIPQVAGRELNLYKLYTEVVRRGGYDHVSNAKLWREIVNEFQLPASCTSASFTLRQHYQKCLLEYERKFFQPPDKAPSSGYGMTRIGFHDSLLRQRGSPYERPQAKQNVGQLPQSTGKRILYRHNLASADYMPRLAEEDAINSHSISSVNLASNSQSQISYQLPLQSTVTESKRLVLAFESRTPKEIVRALNALSLFSCDTDSPFYLDQHPFLVESLQTYLEFLIKKLGMEDVNFFRPLKHFEIQKVEPQQPAPLNLVGPQRSPRGQAVRRDPRNPTKKNAVTTRDQSARLAGTKVGDQKGILPSQLDKLPRAEQLQKLRELGITRTLPPLLTKEGAEHFRQMILILRNLSYVQQNQAYLARNKRLLTVIMLIFMTTTETEVHQHCFSIITNLARHVQLKELEGVALKVCQSLEVFSLPQMFLPNFFENLQLIIDSNRSLSDVVAEGIECLRRFSFVNGNQVVLEDMVDFLAKELIDATMARNVETREGSLEVLIVLTDRKESAKAKVGSVRNCVKRLVALVAGGLVSKLEQKIARFAACVLNNISVVASIKPKLLPYELELAMIAASNSVVSKVICQILHEISEYQVFNKQ